MPSDTSTLAVSNYSVRVRMYRQGLGDCFLLRFPGENGRPFHLVIDSGVIKGTSEPTVKMREVAEDIESETGGKIDVLVVTHEHWDHVSGFAEAREVWERMEIAEVWLAWTEDPANKLAKKLRRERADRKEGIKSKIAQLAAGSSFQLDATRSQRIDALLGFLGFGLGAAGTDGGGTKEALDFIADHAKERLFKSQAAPLSGQTCRVSAFTFWDHRRTRRRSRKATPARRIQKSIRNPAGPSPLRNPAIRHKRMLICPLAHAQAHSWKPRRITTTTCKIIFQSWW